MIVAVSRTTQIKIIFLLQFSIIFLFLNCFYCFPNCFSITLSNSFKTMHVKRICPMGNAVLWLFKQHEIAQSVKLIIIQTGNPFLSYR
jgi:hypothetical protein